MTRLIPARIGILAGIVLAIGIFAGLIVLTRGETASVAEEGTDTDLSALIATLDRGPAPALSGPWSLSLPRDFGAHDNARSETWSIVAHLEDRTGEALSVTVILSRLGATGAVDPGAHPFGPGPVHIGNVVVMSTDSDLRVTGDRVSRMAGTAGHDPQAREVWLDDWVLAYGEDGLDLDLRLGDRALRLSLAAGEAPLGPDGEADGPTRGFAIPSLAVTGTLGSGAGDIAVTGTAWLDRLWGDVPLPGGPLVRDRFVLHLSDGTDLSLLQTRRRDGRGIATIDGVVVTPDEDARGVDDLNVDVTPVYAREDDAVPTLWRIAGAGLDLEARVTDTARQERFGAGTIAGLLTVQGTRDGQPVDGAGTVLLSADGVS